MDNDKGAISRRQPGGVPHKKDDAVRDDLLLDAPVPLTREQVHLGYIPVPRLERLMGLRNALVALKGPLSSDPKVRENLQEQLLSDELQNRILGQVSQPPVGLGAA